MSEFNMTEAEIIAVAEAQLAREDLSADHKARLVQKLKFIKGESDSPLLPQEASNPKSVMGGGSHEDVINAWRKARESVTGEKAELYVPTIPKSNGSVMGGGASEKFVSAWRAAGEQVQKDK